MIDFQVKSVLVIYDSKLSSQNQAVGLVESLKKINKEIKFKEIKIKKKCYFLLPNWLLYFLYKLNILRLEQNLIKKYYAIISCGRITAPLSLFLKQKTGSKIIHILNPYYKINSFDKIILPLHDKYIKNNVIQINGSIVNEKNFNIDKNNLKKFENIFPINKKKIIVILIGGSTKFNKLKVNDLNNFIISLKKINVKNNKLIFLFSRRTPVFFREGLTNFFSKDCIIVNEKTTNPYWYFLKNADFIIVTSDSVSMTSDAIFTGKPVYIYYFKNLKKKILFFQNLLIKEKITRKFCGKIEYWNNRKSFENMKVATQVINYLDNN